MSQAYGEQLRPTGLRWSTRDSSTRVLISADAELDQDEDRYSDDGCDRKGDETVDRPDLVSDVPLLDESEDGADSQRRDESSLRESGSAPATARRSGAETFSGFIVASSASGTREVVSSAVVAKGAFDGIGRVVEIPSLPNDPGNVSRDDLVFPGGAMHLVT
jgi:hypothetical protein